MSDRKCAQRHVATAEKLAWADVTQNTIASSCGHYQTSDQVIINVKRRGNTIFFLAILIQRQKCRNTKVTEQSKLYFVLRNKMHYNIDGVWRKRNVADKGGVSPYSYRLLPMATEETLWQLPLAKHQLLCTAAVVHWFPPISSYLEKITQWHRPRRTQKTSRLWSRTQSR